MTHPSDLSLEEVQRLLEENATSVSDLAHGYVGAYERWEAQVSAFTSFSAQALLAQAAQADRLAERTQRRHLEGIGVSVKDNIDVCGQETRAGSAWFSREAVADASCWARLRVAGALQAGRTNMHEFAFGASTINTAAQTTRNPWDVTRAPGGSSGGAAVSVAIGAAHAALGTDTGGSVRIPAALSGVTGFKPTAGTIPNDGVFPLAGSIDTVGVLSRTAVGCSQVMEALAPSASASATVAAHHGQDDAQPLTGLRIGVLCSHLAASTAEVRERCLLALALIERLGARLQDIELPLEGEARGVTSTIVRFEGARIHAAGLRKHRGDYGWDVLGRLEAGLEIDEQIYLASLDRRTVLADRVIEAQQNVDFVVGPTVPLVAPAIADCVGERAAEFQAALVSQTYTFNVTGQPAISIPAPWSGSSLPVGLQIVGARGEDRAVLDVAAALQAQSDWHLRRPEPRATA